MAEPGEGARAWRASVSHGRQGLDDLKGPKPHSVRRPATNRNHRNEISGEFGRLELQTPPVACMSGMQYHCVLPVWKILTRTAIPQTAAMMSYLANPQTHTILAVSRYRYLRGAPRGHCLESPPVVGIRALGWRCLSHKESLRTHTPVFADLIAEGDGEAVLPVFVQYADSAASRIEPDGKK